MIFSLWTDYGALNSMPVFKAFGESLKKHGHTVTYNDLSADIPVIWSVLWNGRMYKNKKIWDLYRSRKKPVVVLEVGSIKRNTTWKVGINGINRDAYFGNGSNDNTRSKYLGVSLAPWRTHGEHILICCQHSKSHQWHNMPLTADWISDTIAEIRKHSDRPIIVRPHPRDQIISLNKKFKNVSIQMPKKISRADDFDLTFKQAWAVINHNSNPGPQSIINGVPAIVSDSSLAYPVAEHLLSNIENPIMPDRQQWVNDYAWTEYTIDEIADGLPLRQLTPML